MGGYGSGRGGVSRRPLAEGMRRIDLAQLLREGPAITDRHAVKVQCSRGDDPPVEIATIYLESTPMHFGGRRLWFRCPRCDGRCRVLFGTWRIACRRCHRLRFASQRETPSGCSKLLSGRIPRVTHNELPPKPKGMHWCTYDRLAERYAL